MMKKIAQIVLLLFLARLGMGLIYAQSETAESEISESEVFQTEVPKAQVIELGTPKAEITKLEASKSEASESKSVKSQSDVSKVPAPEISPSEGLFKRISLDLRDMDIIDTIKFLSKQGNLNIVTSKNVSGRITLFLNKVTIADVLDVILFTNNLACEKNKDIITIMTDTEYKAIYGRPYIDKRQLKTVSLKYADASNISTVLSNVKSEIGTIIADTGTSTLIIIDVPEKIDEMEELIKKFDLPTIERVIPTVEEVFELSYANAKDIESEISKSLTENIGSISVSERANKVIVRDLAHNMEMIRRLVREFDAKTRQVLIRAEIIEVTLSDDFYMGVEWAKLFSQLDDLTFTGTFPFGSGGASSLGVSVGTLATDDYEAALELVRTVGEIRIVSTPHIAVTNNEEAKFMVGSREAYITSTVTTGEVTTTTSEAVEFIDVGVTLYVTPTINKDGFIKMHIKPEVSSVREWLETSEGNDIPIVETSNIETDVLIKDGRTVVIAGMMKDTIQKTVSKVPFLGDIPLIGSLFKTVDDVKEIKELMVFLTPHIISGEEDLVYVEGFEKPRKSPKDRGYIKEEKPRKPVKK